MQGINDKRISSPLAAAEKREVWGRQFAEHEEDYLAEVSARWGHSQAHAQSGHRVARYRKVEWERIDRDNGAIKTRIKQLMDQEVHPSTSEVMDVPEAQRRRISRWFYQMSHEFQVLKSDRYGQDERFRASIEENTRPGAARWLQVAIKANAARHPSSSAQGSDVS